MLAFYWVVTHSNDTLSELAHPGVLLSYGS